MSLDSNTIFSDISIKLDIVAKFRDDFTATIQICDALNVPIDLTVYTDAKMQVRKTNTPYSVVLTLNTTTGITLGNDGVIDIVHPNNIIPVGIYSYDFQITDDSGVTKTWFGGKFIINSDITV